MTKIAQSVWWFIIAGMCEIGGGYLVWLWLREKKSALCGLLGALILSIYGVIPTLQPYLRFGRIYAAYGGWFIVLSLLWSWRMDGEVPDRFDCIGAAICLVGVAVIMYMPRGAT